MNISTFFTENGLGTYPAIFPDFTITSPSLTTKDGNTIVIQGGIKPQDLVLAEFDLTIIDKMIQINDRVETTITIKSNELITFTFNTGNFAVPAGKNKLTLNDTSVQLRFSPKDFIGGFEASGSFPLNIFGSQHTAKASMDIQLSGAAISSVELGFSVAPGQINLPSFFGKGYIKGGVIGAFFEPPGIILGITGSYEGRAEYIRLPSHECTIVCDVEGDVPIPLYISSNIYSMSMEDLLKGISTENHRLFKNIRLRDTYITWCTKSVMLPNGTMAVKGESFQTYADLLGFEFYGSIAKTDEDLTGAFQSDEINLFNGMLTITGNGKKIESQKRKKESALHDAIMLSTVQRATATEKTLVESGGPILNFSYGKKKVPSLTASGNITFLEKKLLQLESKIDGKNISLCFKFDNGFNNCSGEFQIAKTQIAGQFYLGSVNDLVNYINNEKYSKFMSFFGPEAILGASIRLTEARIFIADFYVEFNGEKISINLNKSIFVNDLNSSQDLVSNIAPNLSKVISQFFLQLAKDPTLILKMLVAKVLNQALFSDAKKLLESLHIFGMAYRNVKVVLNQLGKTITIAETGMKDVLGELEKLDGGITTSQVGVLLNTFGFEGVSQTMNTERAEFIANQLKKVLEATEYEVINAFKEIDVDLTMMTETIVNVYKLTEDGAKILGNIYGELGYKSNDVVSAFKEVGGVCSDAANEIENFGETINPVNWWPF